MKKPVFIIFFLLMVSCYTFAGDAAVFVDEGFSKDGTIYIFGQYGKTDRTFDAYAELYTVDVKKNIFVPGKVFKVAPSRATADKGGKELYEQLVSRQYTQLQNYKRSKVKPDNLLYVCEDATKSGTDAIVFTDFTASTGSDALTYHVQLQPTVIGSGRNASSSFYISVNRKNKSGSVASTYKVGSPNIKRQGVSGYRIDRILRDVSGKHLVFVIEKTLENETGVCIRYMVETLEL